MLAVKTDHPRHPNIEQQVTADLKNRTAGDRLVRVRTVTLTACQRGLLSAGMEAAFRIAKPFASEAPIHIDLARPKRVNADARNVVP